MTVIFEDRFQQRVCAQSFFPDLVGLGFTNQLYVPLVVHNHIIGCAS